MHSVVFICTGNMCRSPMAEGILKKRLAELGRTDIAVSSMGIHAQEGQKATAEGIAVCAEHGVDIAAHLSRPLHFDELKTSELIFAMESIQRDYIRTFVPQMTENLFLLAAWPAEPRDKKSSTVPDPMGGGMGDYRKIFDLIDAHIERILPFLLAQFSRR